MLSIARKSITRAGPLSRTILKKTVASQCVVPGRRYQHTSNTNTEKVCVKDLILTLTII